jgi:hypothetical protein
LNDDVYKDQKQRAQIVVLNALKDDKREIVYLDGHGRMTFCLIETLINIGLFEEFKLTVVEYEHSGHEWHNLFLPREVRKVKGDIVGFLDKRYTRNSNKMNNSYVYFNFCSINTQVDLGITLRRLKKYGSCMISFSVRSPSYESKCYKLAEEIVTQPGCEIVCRRGNFFTFLLDESHNLQFR